MPNPATRRQWVLAVLDRNEGSLLRYAERLLGDGDSAREAVQHAFLQLCEQSPAMLRDCEAAWLFRVCRNKALDLIRLRQRETGDCEADLAVLAGREPDPAEQAQRQELSGELAQRLAELPPNQREAIDLWCEGLSCRQIAEIAGQSEANVRVLVHRAIKQLRECMQASAVK